MKYRDEEVAQPYLSAVDSKYGRCMAVKCVTKGSQDEYAVKALENFCRQLGAEKFFLQSDPEHSIQDVVGKVCAKVTGGMARTTPKQSKQSLGLADRFHGTVESDCRVLFAERSELLSAELLPPIHPIFVWLVRHAAWVHERFRRSRHDGRSAFARHMLREYPSQVVPFGETVIFRDTGPIKCKLRSNWNFGEWLGRDSQDDMHILGTRQGIVKAWSVKRTIPSERYDQQLLLQMKGRLYDIKGEKKSSSRHRWHSSLLGRALLPLPRRRWQAQVRLWRRFQLRPQTCQRKRIQTTWTSSSRMPSAARTRPLS